MKDKPTGADKRKNSVAWRGKTLVGTAFLDNHVESFHNTRPVGRAKVVSATGK
jgi:hypothetical protein